MGLWLKKLGNARDMKYSFIRQILLKQRSNIAYLLKTNWTVSFLLDLRLTKRYGVVFFLTLCMYTTSYEGFL